MSTGLIKIIKQACSDLMENNQLCDLRFGTVISTSPLKVKITNNFIIPEKLLIVSEKLTDYKMKISFDDPSIKQQYTTWNIPETEVTGSGKIAFTKKIQHEITIYNHLQVGDKVVMVRKTGGQAFYILDRVEGGYK